eukprot:3100356-Rhodomonas_salina.1
MCVAQSFETLERELLNGQKLQVRPPHAARVSFVTCDGCASGEDSEEASRQRACRERERERKEEQGRGEERSGQLEGGGGGGGERSRGEEEKRRRGGSEAGWSGG